MHSCLTVSLNYCQLTFSCRPTLNKEIFVEIQSIDILEHFTYQVISQGRLIYSDSLDVPQRNYHVFQFLATFDLLPTVHLIVYYFKNNDIISAKVDIDIRENLNNFIKLKLSQENVKPGETVNIDITTNPKSLVGLVGVDSSVLLLKKNNDLTIDDVWDERELYQYQLHERNAKSSHNQSPYYYNRYWADFQVFSNKLYNLYIYLCFVLNSSLFLFSVGTNDILHKCKARRYVNVMNGKY